jgi:hypothetical protein
MLIKQVYLVSKRFFGVPVFFNYALADGLYTLLYAQKTRVNNLLTGKNRNSNSVSSFGKRVGKKLEKLLGSSCASKSDQFHLFGPVLAVVSSLYRA